MSSTQLEKLKEKTVLLEDKISFLQTSVNCLKSQLLKPSTENSEETKEIDDDAVVFCADNVTKISVKNGSLPVVLHRGTFHPQFASIQGLNWCYDNFEPNENDIFLQSYPKCGSTLGLQLLYNILSKSGKKVLGSRPDIFPCPARSFLWLSFKTSQNLAKYGNNNAIIQLLNNNSSNSVRLWKTHCNLTSFLCKNGKYSGKGKIIHISRNPKDIIQSGYKFFLTTTDYSGDFESYFSLFINGLLVYNDFFKYEMDTVKMIKKYGKDKILFLYFEDIILNPINEINKIVKFLNITNLTQNEMKEITKLISFDYLKQTQRNVMKKNKDLFMVPNLNKGKIGTWKSVLSKEQSEIIDKIIKQRIEPFNKELEENMKIKWNFG